MRNTIVYLSFFTFFFAGCSNSIQTQQLLHITHTVTGSTWSTLSVWIPPVLKEYCKRKSEKDFIWECIGLYNYPGGPQAFGDACKKAGFQFHCEWNCGGGECYIFASSGKTCSYSTDCESNYCVPIDKDCKDEKCFGACSSHLPPNHCSSAEIFHFPIIENNKVLMKKAGGAICD